MVVVLARGLFLLAALPFRDVGTRFLRCCVARLVAGGAMLAGGCDQPGVVPACAVVVPVACPESPPRYADVAPILAARCGSCHVESSDGSEPWPLDTYDNVAEWAGLIRQDVLDCTMPPADSSVRMTANEAWTIVTWIACGTPP